MSTVDTRCPARHRHLTDRIQIWVDRFPASALGRPEVRGAA